ncbi:hypothetical protein GZH46_02879, partial [Fragariocoptes setiger]
MPVLKSVMVHDDEQHNENIQLATVMIIANLASSLSTLSLEKVLDAELTQAMLNRLVKPSTNEDVRRELLRAFAHIVYCERLLNDSAKLQLIESATKSVQRLNVLVETIRNMDRVLSKLSDTSALQLATECIANDANAANLFLEKGYLQLANHALETTKVLDKKSSEFLAALLSRTEHETQLRKRQDIKQLLKKAHKHWSKLV